MKKHIKPSWILSSPDYPGDKYKMQQAISAYKNECKLLDIDEHLYGKYEHFEDDDCVIYHGNIRFGEKLNRNVNWCPGVICTSGNFKCDYYYHLLGNELVNYPYLMLPYHDLKNLFSYYCDLFKTDKLFIRPNSGLKSFEGGIYTLDNLNDIEKSIDNNELCLISTTKDIKKEFRCIVVDGKIIASSQYKQYGEFYEDDKVHDSILEYAQNCTKKLNNHLDKAYTIDIAVLPRNVYKVLEINAFSYSAFYECDKYDIVNAMNKLAIKMWEENNLF